MYPHYYVIYFLIAIHGESFTGTDFRPVSIRRCEGLITMYDSQKYTYVRMYVDYISAFTHKRKILSSLQMHAYTKLSHERNKIIRSLVRLND